MTSRHTRAYAALLRLYPRRFRADYRREMVLLFAQQLNDARSSRERAGVIRLWLRSLVDLLTTAPSEHFAAATLVAQPAVGVDEPNAGSARPLRTAALITAMAPAFTLLVVGAIATNFMDPMFQKPPEALGLPLGSVILGLCILWYAAGLAILAKATSALTRLAAVILFVGPATFGIVLGPAIILIMQNLAT